MTVDARPKYIQLAESLTGRIANKEWTPDIALPSEMSLAREYGVSQGTMRKAIDQLVAQHVVSRQQGRGTFVATHDSGRALRHYFHIVSDTGKRELPVCRVVQRDSAVASETEADRLRVRVGAQVLRFLRVRSLAASPIITERITIPVSRFPNIRFKPLDDLPSLLYEHYSKQYGVIVTEAIEKLRGVAADAFDVRHLGLTRGQPVLEVDRIALDILKKPVEWRVTHCNTTTHHYL